MTAPRIVDTKLDCLALGRELLAGALLVWRRVPALVELAGLADAKLRAGFEDDPLTAEASFAPDGYLKRVRGLRSAFRADEAINVAFKRALTQIGLTPGSCYWDPLQLRVVPSKPTHQGRRIMPLPQHRDNWGSNIPQQLNWWSPIYPVSEGRTILFYPRYFDRAVANSSAEWDFEELKRLMDEGKAEQYPVLPVLTEELPAEEALPVVIEPGDMLGFSGQHLHGSIATDTSLPRFSVECRSVNLDHVQAGLSAPNPDGRAPRVVPDWFEHVVTGERLTSDMIASL